MEIFLPFSKNPYTTNRDECFSIRQMTKFTNMKAILAGAGDTCYPDFKPFTTKEVQQHLGIYILYRCASLPQVEYKFHPQHEDKVHGNDFV